MRPSKSIDVHPTSFTLSELPTKTFDVVCIGSGWAGRVLAGRIVEAGLTAVIIEKELFGGECPFWACVPSKALLRSPEVLDATKRVGGAKERVNGERVDVAATFQRRDRILSNWDDTKVLVPLTKSTGATLVRGFGRLNGVKKVEVLSQQGEVVELQARLAVALCTGSEPVIPNIPGLKEVDPWTPRDATSSSDVPKHLLILGGGAVGCETATAYIKFGARVTLISTSENILRGVDPHAARIVRTSLESQGVVFQLGLEIREMQRLEGGDVVVTLSSGQRLQGSEIVIATGRKADLGSLSLDSIGLDLDGNFVPVNEGLDVKGVDGEWLYALGDVNGRALLTHTSKYHAAVAANKITSRANNIPQDKWTSNAATADHHAIPRVVFTDPIIATVGLNLTTAKKQGKYVREVSVPMRYPVGIHGDDESNGWAQWLLDNEKRLVGATFVGTDAAELLHPSTVAIVGEMTVDRLMHAIPSWPTLSWVYYDLMDAAGV